MKLEVFEATMANGKKLRIVAEATVGAFGIHHRIFNARPIDDGWTVSHMPTGRAIWTVEARADALKVATALHVNKLIPEGREEALEWIIALSAAERAKLTEKLTKMAPRLFRPHDSLPYPYSLAVGERPNAYQG